MINLLMKEKNKENGNFGFLEMIGSIIMLLIDTNRMDNKKYLDKKYYRLNKIIGIITVISLLFVIVYLILK